MVDWGRGKEATAFKPTPQFQKVLYIGDDDRIASKPHEGYDPFPENSGFGEKVRDSQIVEGGDDQGAGAEELEAPR
jgi:hypothetical protein